VKVVRGGAKPPRGAAEVVTPEGVRVRVVAEPAPRSAAEPLRSNTAKDGGGTPAGSDATTPSGASVSPRTGQVSIEPGRTLTPAGTAGRLGIDLRSLEPAPNATTSRVLRPPRGKAPIGEVRLADDVARATGRTVVLTRASHTAGIDGFFLETGTPIQLKTVTSNSVDKVITRINDAYTKARAANWDGVDVYIEARQFTAEQIRTRWTATNRTPARADLSDGTITKVVIYTLDGVVELPLP
jgi:hypothetical protein